MHTSEVALTLLHSPLFDSPVWLYVFLFLAPFDVTMLM